MFTQGNFFTLFSCGEPVAGDTVCVLYTSREAAEEALAWYVVEGEALGFDDSAAEIREVVLAPAVQNGMV